MDMGNVIIGDIIPRVDNGINGIIFLLYKLFQSKENYHGRYRPV